MKKLEQAIAYFEDAIKQKSVSTAGTMNFRRWIRCEKANNTEGTKDYE